MAAQITVNAKTTRPAVCNAAESLLVHADVAAGFLPKVFADLKKEGVEIRGCEVSQKYGAIPATQEDYETEFTMEYDPANPDADENGYVSYPNVNIVTEMTNLIDASRAYEANATAFDASKAMAQAGLQIGKS